MNIQLITLPLDEAAESHVPALCDALSSEERARSERFRKASDRILFIAAHALLRTALAAMTGQPSETIIIAHTTLGKPFLTSNPTLHFSLTHTAGLCAVAFHKTPIGCDAERMDRTCEEEYLGMLANEERVWLAQMPPSPIRDQAFARIWTAKEAFMKALGVGLLLDPSSFIIKMTENRVTIKCPPPLQPLSQSWKITSHDIDTSHCIAIAVRSKNPLSEGLIINTITLEKIETAVKGGPMLTLPEWCTN